MCCFEDIDHITTSYGAPVLVRLQKDASKFSLALALNNRSKNAIPLIFDTVGKEEARLINALALQLEPGQRIARDGSGGCDLKELDQGPSDLWTNIFCWP